MFIPRHEGEFPTLGWAVLDWIEAYLAAPDRAEFEPFIPYREQALFVLNWYRLDPVTGRRAYRRGVLSRPRGWGKSPFVAAIVAVEALGPVVFDGWDAAGRPVGKPWSEVRTPLVQVTAVSETQTKNTWAPLLEMLDSSKLIEEYRGLEPLDTFVNLPRGRIEPITSSARSTKGNRAVFADLDQTEEWVPSVGGPRFAQVLRTNAAKVGGTTIETPNAFEPGANSVAEQTAQFAQAIADGRARDDGLLYDHREAPPETDIYDDESLITGLEVAYGDSSTERGGHVDVARFVAEFHDLGNDVQTLRGDYLNQITHATDAWLSQPEVAARVNVDRLVADREPITIGFDGSLGRRKGKADATALIGCTIDGAHYFELGVWEPPDGPAGRDWRVPVSEVEATVRLAFAKYRPVGFYADPAKWGDHVARWEAEYHDRLVAKASTDHPISFSTSSLKTMVEAVDQLHTDIVQGDMTYSGESALTRHLLNARRRTSRAGILIAKEHPDSDRKIDAAYAAVLAGRARRDAIAKGVARTRDQFAPRRVR